MSPPCSPDTPEKPTETDATAPQKRKPLFSAKFWSGVVGVPILLVLLWFGGWVLFIPATAAMLIGLEEFYRGVERKGVFAFRAAGYACATGIFAATQFVPDDPAWRSGLITTCLAGAVLLSMVGQFWRPTGSSVISNSGTTVFGVVWVGLLFSFFLRLRLVELSCMESVPVGGFRDRMGAVFLVVLAVWLQDNAAQLTGRTFGTKKPWPHISPNKTWEGCVGGLFACVVGLTAVGTAFGLPTLHMVVLGLIMGVLGQLGDFCKSLIKREIGVKDFGSIIPGHGGVLDRFDSLLFAMPVGYAYFRLFIMPFAG